MIMVIIMAVYVLNEDGAYFVISQFVDVSINLLMDKGCRIFNSIDDLYDAASDENDLDRDDIEGTELRIFERDGDEYCYDYTHDHEEDISGLVEFYIADYVL